MQTFLLLHLKFIEGKQKEKLLKNNSVFCDVLTWNQI